MKYIKFTGLYTAFIALQGCLCYEIVTPPDRQITALVGEDVELVCQVRNTQSGTYVEWKEYIDTGSLGTRIWLSPPNQEGIVHANRTKYEIQGMFNLRVESASIYDGGKYTCGLPVEDILHEAHIMVLAQPECGSSFNSHDGEEMFVTCRAEFGGEQIPEVAMYLEGNRLDALVVDDQVFSRTIQYNMTGNWLNDGKQITCFSRSANPFRQQNCTMNLDIKHSVRNVRTEPSAAEVYVGDIINCTASGNPAPEFSWRRLGGGGLISSPFLPVTSDMMSQAQQWVCTAQNRVRNQLQTVTHQYDFSVLPAVTQDPVGRASHLTLQIWVLASITTILILHSSFGL